MVARQAGSGRKRPAPRRLAALKEELGRALARSVAEFENAAVPFALVGGLAVGVRVDPRVTRDIDFVVPAADDAAAEATVFALQRRGFIVESVFVREGDRISTVRTRHSAAPSVLVDLLLSNSRIEPEIVAAASLEEVASGIRCPVAQPWHLLAMKVLANRKKDQADLQGLIERSDKKEDARALTALAMMQERGAAPRRDLSAELRQLIRDVREKAPFERPASKGRLAKMLAHNPKPSKRRR